MCFLWIIPTQKKKVRNAELSMYSWLTRRTVRLTKNLMTFCWTSWVLGPIWSPLSSFWPRFFGQIIVLCWHFLPASRWMARAIFIWIIFHTSRDMGQLLHFSANMALCAVSVRKTRVSGISGECYIVGQKPAIFLEFLWGYLTH